MKIEQIEKFGPLYQVLVALIFFFVSFSIHSDWGTGIKSDWYSVCLGLIAFLIMNPVVGLFQTNPGIYLLKTIGILMVYLGIFLMLSRFNVIDKLSANRVSQTFLMISMVFFVGITGISQLIRSIYQMTKHM